METFYCQKVPISLILVYLGPRKRKDENVVMRQKIIMLSLELPNRIFSIEGWGDGLVIIKCLLSQSKDLGLSPRTHIKVASQMWRLTLVIPALGGSNRWTPELNGRPALDQRETVSKEISKVDDT